MLFTEECMPVSKFRTHRLANLIETAIIMVALFGLLLFIAWLFAGSTGMLFICMAGIPALLIGGARAGRLVLGMYRASPLDHRSAPELMALVEELARRVELPHTPHLYYIPSRAPLAFSVGLGTRGAVALSDGLLRMLSWRELVGVVAHEISHIAGKDIQVMGVADVASRLVSAVSTVGQVLVIFNLPLYLLGNARLPWLPLGIMLIAPVLMTLLQLALSRSREYEADRTAAELTGDPLGLASALERMERTQRQQMRRLLLPYGNVEVPSILRTHPGTVKRIERLVELAREGANIAVYPHLLLEDRGRRSLPSLEVPNRPPRRSWWGVWY
jgi:heat shock protein HtpX